MRWLAPAQMWLGGLISGIALAMIVEGMGGALVCAMGAMLVTFSAAVMESNRAGRK